CGRARAAVAQYRRVSRRGRRDRGPPRTRVAPGPRLPRLPSTRATTGRRADASGSGSVATDRRWQDPRAVPADAAARAHGCDSPMAAAPALRRRLPALAVATTW